MLHVHFSELGRWRNRRMWLLSVEAFASLVWVLALLAALVLTVFGLLVDEGENLVGFALAWGVAICLVATIQMIVALNLERGYDRSIIRALVVGALYPVAFWLVSATAALHSEIIALARGPRAAGSCGISRASKWRGSNPPRAPISAGSSQAVRSERSGASP